MNLVWSHSINPLKDSFEPFTNLSPEMEKYCFIGRMLRPENRKEFPEFDVEKCPEDKTCLKIDVEIGRYTKEHIILPGTYRIECLIGSSNTKALKKHLKFIFLESGSMMNLRCIKRGLE